LPPDRLGAVEQHADAQSARQLMAADCGEARRRDAAAVRAIGRAAELAGLDPPLEVG
jgi:hypothetical protein